MDHSLQTPAFIFEDHIISNTLVRLREITDQIGVNLLYSPKACAVSGVMDFLADKVDGFSCSSLNEARLARSHFGPGEGIHLVTPGIKEHELGDIAETCDVVVLNSYSQWQRFSGALAGKVQLGLRINPQISFAEDERYDPCRKHSKLGVPLDWLRTELEANSDALRGLDGLHVHNNCESYDATQLAKTVERLTDAVPRLFERVSWINLGGGYMLSGLENPDVFTDTILRLKEQFGVEVYIEPGAALVQSTGSIVSSVIDLFESDGVTVAVLDTTVNHMPEVFEYQFIPDVLGHVEGAKYQYLLAGCTCLAGDQFGMSSFDAPLSIGSQVVFLNAGAYTMSRANTFNGVSLPAIYRRTLDGELILEKEHTYEDFVARSEGRADVGV